MKHLCEPDTVCLRASADQGDIYFADLYNVRGRKNAHPVLIIGRNDDSNDLLDVIVCICTSKPSRSCYDVPVQLDKPSMIRTNKIYTIPRENLHFKIPHALRKEDIEQIIELALSAIRPKEHHTLFTT